MGEGGAVCIPFQEVTSKHKLCRFLAFALHFECHKNNWRGLLLWGPLIVPPCPPLLFETKILTCKVLKNSANL